MKTKENKAITLIALVVTIVVLLILAGISINMITGQNGILNRTQNAKENTENASDLEYLQTKAYEAITNYYANGSNEPETEYVLKSLNNSGITADVNTGLITYNGKTYDISDIMGKTSEQKAIEAQTDVKIKQITKLTATGEDVTLFETGKIRMIIEEELDSTNRAVIPNGFYYVTGAPSTGLVVSDKFGDDDNNTKGGNQFVWVPCEGTAGVTYEKTDNADNKYGLASTWKSKYSESQTYYSNYNDWRDNEGDLESVNTYGGFYIARYEAGVPINASFYVNTNGANYVEDKNPSDLQIIGENETNLTAEQLKNKLIPVSKKNTQCWNEITQENAIKVSKAMYYNNSFVKSSLVDSYAWDTIIEWFVKDSNQYPDIATRSMPYGNFSDNFNIKVSNVLYALHRHGVKGSSGYWTTATKYGKGEIKSGLEPTDAEKGPLKYEFAKDTYLEGYTYDIRKKLATGVSDVTKVKNIYDMAGNMWEWTTEIGNRNGQSETYAVLRGGSFTWSGASYPITCRHGGNTIDKNTDSNYGFRVVLYIK